MKRKLKKKPLESKVLTKNEYLRTLNIARYKNKNESSKELKIINVLCQF